MQIAFGTALLLLLNAPSPDQVGIRFGLDLVVFQAGNGSIDFEDCQRNLVDGADAMLAQGAVQFVDADALARHV